MAIKNKLQRLATSRSVKYLIHQNSYARLEYFPDSPLVALKVLARGGEASPISYFEQDNTTEGVNSTSAQLSPTDKKHILHVLPEVE